VPWWRLGKEDKYCVFLPKCPAVYLCLQEVGSPCPGRFKVQVSLEGQFGSRRSLGCPGPGRVGLQLLPADNHSSWRAEGRQQAQHTEFVSRSSALPLALAAAAACPWFSHCY